MRFIAEVERLKSSIAMANSLSQDMCQEPRYVSMCGLVFESRGAGLDHEVACRTCKYEIWQLKIDKRNDLTDDDYDRKYSEGNF